MYHLLAEPRYIHSVPAYKVDHKPYRLCRAVSICTVRCRAPRLSYKHASAFGTALGHFKRLLSTVSFFFYDRHHLGNYFPCLLYYYSVAYSYILFSYKILVVKCCSCNVCSRNKNAFKLCRRSNNSRSAHLESNVLQKRFLLFRRKLVRNCPPRSFCGVTEHLSLCKVIYLEHKTVYVIIERISFHSPFLANASHFFAR